MLNTIVAQPVESRYTGLQRLYRLIEHMLEQLFGSRTRVKLLRLFLTRNDDRFYVREISRVVDEQINSVRRELNNLEDIGLLLSETEDKKKYYRVNQDFPLFSELRTVVFKSRITLEKEFIQSIKSLGSIDYMSLTGYFVNDDSSQVDIFVVGTVNRTRLIKLLERFREVFGTQLRFTVMDRDEYLYRRDVTDKFLYQILNGKQIVLIDRTVAKKAEDAQ